ncbi:prolipoprotein diacylglyceryl transferase [Rubrimonas cliftonensis]|uniref:Phosphatidylglycerol--prolipoprotein diacylglyceryl transferase n=1 Tax=Rubrimonas cliftonensis TaxID=89524 RepID=A0A1H3VJK5_9RHOB|nr:prolipoprotein diacylglyceryl transferase [Rubrimonas cliftonensis]SDZ74328.1 phosphatidylglycerol:prolipoprotein diacylglycerol transferase [Rubrimonas cliftonensis]
MTLPPLAETAAALWRDAAPLRAALPFPQIDPALLSVDLGFVTLSLRWYALAYIAGLALGWWIVRALMRRPALWPGRRAPMTPEQPEELLTWMVAGVILGGRLGFVLFYQPAYYLAHPLEALAIWQGGMSFHGGFLGVVVAALLWSLRNAAPPLSVGDALAVATPPGLLFGRLANFVNGELWGRPTEAWFGMVFPGGGPLPRHPSQLYEAALEGLLLGALLLWLALAQRWTLRPGALTGAFLAGYGAARAFVENFRQGDAQFVTAGNPNGQALRFGDGAEAWGLTMGQILSLPMLFAGLLLIAYAFARKRPQTA